jgi:hypothetical protein
MPELQTLHSSSPLARVYLKLYIRILHAIASKNWINLRDLTSVIHDRLDLFAYLRKKSSRSDPAQIRWGTIIRFLNGWDARTASR